ncbi:primary-amine oxidase [Trichoderma cornu-damae]|uniref:Amine oxidase n=1 Tax=Trichoderma cornu-damae TaxID=654480 RepID=A0A9P8QPA0_9HYPO|nr:primary-amine oxidase [Trichoderma cornu-damae]
MVHPFEPIGPGEISLAADILREALGGVSLRFKVIDVQEPVKERVIPYIEAERTGGPLPPAPPRLAYSYLHRLDTHAFVKAVVNLDSRTVVSLGELPKHVQGPVDVDEMIGLEAACLQHPSVVDEIAKLRLPEGVTMCADPWVYGTDDEAERRRLVQFYMFVVSADHPQTNHYSLPCAFSPVMDASTRELVRIDRLPTGGGHGAAAETQPWKPVKPVEYAHDLLGTPLRDDVRPLIVQQPEGPSFSLAGRLVSWQRWRFRVGFNSREGLVLYNVTFGGRNVFYRLALSEMTVPYGDPRRPFHRKQAFDVGDIGLGITCNQLRLGCDCLGHIAYLDGFRADSAGRPVRLHNVVCLHEQDAGILHKHTNYRNSEATVVRSRQLVVQMICTVSNYEYIFAWVLDQAGGVEFEVRATGVLSTMPTDDAQGLRLPWATPVGPGVSAPHHQHIFNLRVDPAIDGFNNTVVYEDSVPLVPEEHGVEDPFGVGFVTRTTVLDRAGFADTDVELGRVFKIRNDGVVNAVSRRPVAYKVQTVASQRMLASPRSFNARRARFHEHAVWVTRHQDGELYAAGEFTNQSRDSAGVDAWAARGDDVENQDVVFWHTFALTHIPRPEDFPVMPVERLSVHFKPVGFHEKNPALDVPSSRQAVNKSTLVEAEAEAVSCCEEEAASKL